VLCDTVTGSSQSCSALRMSLACTCWALLSLSRTRFSTIETWSEVTCCTRSRGLGPRVRGCVARRETSWSMHSSFGEPCASRSGEAYSHQASKSLFAVLLEMWRKWVVVCHRVDSGRSSKVVPACSVESRMLWSIASRAIRTAPRVRLSPVLVLRESMLREMILRMFFLRAAAQVALNWPESTFLGRPTLR
jgi:hypothetical protein